MKIPSLKDLLYQLIRSNLINRQVLVAISGIYCFHTRFLCGLLLLVPFLSDLQILPLLQVASTFRCLTTPTLSNLLISNHFNKFKGFHFQWCCSFLENKNADKFSCHFLGWGQRLWVGVFFQGNKGKIYLAQLLFQLNWLEYFSHQLFKLAEVQHWT